MCTNEIKFKVKFVALKMYVATRARRLMQIMNVCKCVSASVQISIFKGKTDAP